MWTKRPEVCAMLLSLAFVRNFDSYHLTSLSFVKAVSCNSTQHQALYDTVFIQYLSHTRKVVWPKCDWPGLFCCDLLLKGLSRANQPVALLLFFHVAEHCWKVWKQQNLVQRKLRPNCKTEPTLMRARKSNSNLGYSIFYQMLWSLLLNLWTVLNLTSCI